LFAQIVSWIANTGFRSTEKPTTPLDHMPSQWRKKITGKAPEQLLAEKRQRIADGFRTFFAA